jgi:hypothetical protein
MATFCFKTHAGERVNLGVVQASIENAVASFDKSTPPAQLPKPKEDTWSWYDVIVASGMAILMTTGGFKVTPIAFERWKMSLVKHDRWHFTEREEGLLRQFLYSEFTYEGWR